MNTKLKVGELVEHLLPIAKGKKTMIYNVIGDELGSWMLEKVPLDYMGMSVKSWSVKQLRFSTSIKTTRDIINNSEDVEITLE
jgi:hypothetical protein